MKTGNGMVEYARNRLGTPYFYGAKIPEGALTERKMSTMHAMYPKVVTISYMAKARRKGQGQCGLLWTDRRLPTA